MTDVWSRGVDMTVATHCFSSWKTEFKGVYDHRRKYVTPVSGPSPFFSLIIVFLNAC